VTQKPAFRLPMLEPSATGSDTAGGGSTGRLRSEAQPESGGLDVGRLFADAGRPDPARLEAGWEHRFVAEGRRADEMIALYRELGFEVAADPVPTLDMRGGCAACFGSSTDSHRSIYTRRPQRAPTQE